MQRLSRKLQEWVGLFRSPLSLRIVSSIFLSLAVIEGIVLIPSVEKRQQEILSQNEEVSAGKVNWILMTYPEANGPELLTHLEELGANPMLETILGGAVYEADGTLVGEFGEVPTIAFDDIRRDRPQYLNTDAGRRYDVAWTAQQANGDEYELVLRHDAAGTQRALNLYILRVLGIVLLIAAFMTLVMMVLLNRQLIQPILTLRKDLSNAGRAIADDQPTPQFESCRYYRPDELGEVIATFRSMYQEIEQAVGDRKLAEADLRAHNAQMQQYLQEVNRVTAAAMHVDAGTFTPDSLDEVAARSDELGKLAQMFQLMATHIQEREQQLQRQLQELSIEIDHAKRQKEVARITKSQYFQEIQTELENYTAEEFWG